ncbi:uncharacterized protein Hap1MRO34_025976 isoform 2-T2 [Clarias gariepinus]
MWLLTLTSLLVYGSVHTAHGVLYYITGTEGRGVHLYCRNDGSVIWSKGKGRQDILTVKPGGDTIKHNPEQDHRYSVLDDLSLYIRDLSLSDSGIYDCNIDTVYNLTVTTVSVVSLTVTPLQGIMTTNPMTEDTDRKGLGGKDKSDDDDDDDVNKKEKVKEVLTVTIVVLVSCMVVLLFALPMWKFFQKMKEVQQNQVQANEYVDLPAAPKPGIDDTQNQTNIDDSIDVELPESPQSGDQQRVTESVYFLANVPSSNATGEPPKDNEGVYYLAAHSTSKDQDQD